MIVRNVVAQPAINCSKLAIEALEHGVKYVQINNKDTRTTPLCASKSFIKPLSAFIKPSEASQWRRSGAFIVNLLLAYFAICSSVSIENFEHVVAGYE